MTKYLSRIAATVLLTGTLLLPAGASAEVRFGKNVRIGGHDVSNQTFNSRRRGVFYIYNKKPPRPGCSWRRNRDGSITKVCHWQRKRR